MSKVTVVNSGTKIDYRIFKSIVDDVDFLAGKSYSIADIAVCISEKYGLNTKAENDKVYLT